MVKGDAIGGDENASAIFSETTMNENFFGGDAGIAAKNGEELRDLFTAGSGPAAYGEMDEADSQSIGLLALPFDLVRILAAKIDDGGDAEFLELLQTIRVGLCAAV